LFWKALHPKRQRSDDEKMIAKKMKKYIRYLAQFRHLEVISFTGKISKLAFEIIRELNLLLPSFSSNPKISICPHHLDTLIGIHDYPTEFFRKVCKIDLMDISDFLFYALSNVSELRSLQILKMCFNHHTRNYHELAKIQYLEKLKLLSVWIKPSECILFNFCEHFSLLPNIQIVSVEMKIMRINSDMEFKTKQKRSFIERLLSLFGVKKTPQSSPSPEKDPIYEKFLSYWARAKILQNLSLIIRTDKVESKKVDFFVNSIVSQIKSLKNFFLSIDVKSRDPFELDQLLNSLASSGSSLEGLTIWPTRTLVDPSKVDISNFINLKMLSFCGSLDSLDSFRAIMKLMNHSVDTTRSSLGIAVNSVDELKELFQRLIFLYKKNKIRYSIELGDIDKDIFLTEFHSFLESALSGSIRLLICTKLQIELEDMKKIGDAVRYSNSFIELLEIMAKSGELRYIRRTNELNIRMNPY